MYSGSSPGYRDHRLERDHQRERDLLSGRSSSSIRGATSFHSSRSSRPKDLHHQTSYPPIGSSAQSSVRRSSGGGGGYGKSGAAGFFADEEDLLPRDPTSDLHYYGGMTSGVLERNHHHRGSSSHRGSGGGGGGASSTDTRTHQQLLCRCGSGGALPQDSPTSGGFITGAGGGSQYTLRSAQSLPSTPNAGRRPLSPQPPPILSAGLPRPGRLDLLPPLGCAPPAATRQELNLSSVPGAPPPPPPPPPPPVPVLQDLPRGPGEPCYAMYTSGGGVGGPPPPPGQDRTDLGPVVGGPPGGPGTLSESAVLAGDLGGEDGLGEPGGTAAARRAALQNWNQQRRSLRYRTRSQPLMKLSTLVIIAIAFIIIGFIVLSPLFHYFM